MSEDKPPFPPESSSSRNSSLPLDISQDVFPEEYADFLPRLGAFLIDGVIISLPSCLFFYAGPLLPLLVGLIYKPVFEFSELQATPGKAMMGMVVIDESTKGRISQKKAFVRFLCLYLSSLPLGAGFFLSLFTEKHQTFHDMAVGTLVVKRVSPKVNYFSFWWEEVKKFFDEVKKS